MPRTTGRRCGRYVSLRRTQFVLIVLHVDIAPGVDPRFAARRMGHIAHQNQALRALGPGEDLENRIGQVEAVADDPGVKTILCQLLPDVVVQTG